MNMINFKLKIKGQLNCFYLHFFENNKLLQLKFREDIYEFI